MAHPIVRTMPFSFAADIPFQWQPENPAFGIFGNILTFVAVPFERFIVSAVRQAKPRISDPDVAEEAEVFLRQEAQHANAHRKHMQALVGQYPGLEECYKSACVSYDELLETESLEFNLAYIANLEATFTPMFKVVLDHRDPLFRGADPLVTSMLTWHFVEEIEHRSSGLAICNYVTGSKWYRARHIRGTFRHVHYLSAMISRAFDEHVPPQDRMASAVEVVGSRRAALGQRLPKWLDRSAATSDIPPVFESVPTTEIAKMVWRLALSQLPLHRPHTSALARLGRCVDARVRPRDRHAHLRRWSCPELTTNDERRVVWRRALLPPLPFPLTHQVGGRARRRIPQRRWRNLSIPLSIHLVEPDGQGQPHWTPKAT